MTATRKALIWTGVGLALVAVCLAIALALISRDRPSADSGGAPDASNSARTDVDKSIPPATPPASHRIPTNLDKDALARVLVEDLLTAWDNGGAEDSLGDRTLAENESWDDVIPELVDEQADAFCYDMFVPGWQDSSMVSDFVERQRGVNEETLRHYVATVWAVDSPGPYSLDERVTAVEESVISETERTLLIWATATPSNGVPTKWVYRFNLRTIGDAEFIFLAGVISG